MNTCLSVQPFNSIVHRGFNKKKYKFTLISYISNCIVSALHLLVDSYAYIDATMAYRLELHSVLQKILKTHKETMINVYFGKKCGVKFIFLFYLTIYFLCKCYRRVNRNEEKNMVFSVFYCFYSVYFIMTNNSVLVVLFLHFNNKKRTVGFFIFSLLMVTDQLKRNRMN